jgi:UDP-N-acetylmuramoyl-L-alanyl-D-glutamate--2,6-diaminopimelate ligase
MMMGFPGRKMVVIGVTGTNGKSTTCNFIASILEEAGYKVGMTTTVNFRVNGREWLNNKKMTMLGRSQLQRLLAQMRSEGCEIAIIETSSEGLAQGRHLGIAYDIAVFTNLTPEHIQSHGSFENYKKAKGILFAALAGSARKTLRGNQVPKTIIVNDADEHAVYYESFTADKKVRFHIDDHNATCDETSCTFNVDNTTVHLPIAGIFNVENALAAIEVAKQFGVSAQTAATALAKIPGVPGRMERINEGQSFAVIVDYAPEPASFTKLYEAVETMPHGRIIHVFGSCGGGRDQDRRPILGAIAGERADIVVITNEDPYDDNPMEIIRDVANGAINTGKIEGENLFIEPDRRVAINHAISLAKAGDIVLVTGKGAEQAMVVANGKMIPWDDREVVRAAIRAQAR